MDIITGTLGKALGGASGGFTSGRQEIVDLLRQRSRPYLFSNTIAPPLAAGSIKALELLEKDPSLLRKLQENTRYFRSRMTERGFQIPEGIHPIVPILIGDEKTTVEMAADLSRRGIFVVGFSFPVVPRGQARNPGSGVSRSHPGSSLTLPWNSSRSRRELWGSSREFRVPSSGFRVSRFRKVGRFQPINVGPVAGTSAEIRLTFPGRCQAPNHH